MTRTVKQVLVVAGTAFALGCGASTVCALVGCDSGLLVQIQNPPPGAISVQARVIGATTAVYTATCPGANGCTNAVFFADFTPGRVQLTITTTGGTRTQEVSPAYTVSQPNGPSCAPACRRATVPIPWV